MIISLPSGIYCDVDAPRRRPTPRIGVLMSHTMLIEVVYACISAWRVVASWDRREMSAKFRSRVHSIRTGI